jgi:hypothetical protein
MHCRLHDMMAQIWCGNKQKGDMASHLRGSLDEQKTVLVLQRALL